MEEAGLDLNSLPLAGPVVIRNRFDLAHADIILFEAILDLDVVPQITTSWEHEGYMWVDPRSAWVHQLPFTGRVTRETLADLRDQTQESKHDGSNSPPDA